MMLSFESIQDGILLHPLLLSLGGRPGFWETMGTPLYSLAVIFIVSILSYTFAISKYHYTHHREEVAQLPPAYPSIIPVLGHLISFIWDNEGFFRRVTSYKGSFTSARLSFFSHDVYLFQDRDTIKKMWKMPTLSSPMSIQIYCLKYLFGLSDQALAIYRGDRSGPHTKPYPGSNVKPESRVDYRTHREFLRALTGPGLPPTLRRYMGAFSARMDQLRLPDTASSWHSMDDFQNFFHKTMGAALIEALLGPSLLRLNPTFVEDLIEFDNHVPWLARGVPSFIMPKPHSIRNRLREQLKVWHTYARKHFHESSIGDDGDGDPFWGSELVRNRHAILNEVGHRDDDLAATDLGLAFGLMTNTNPTAMMTIWHIFKDPHLLRRVRDDLQECFGSEPIRDVDPKRLLKVPLLLSAYAEVLRLYVKIYVMVSPQHEDALLGRWKLPRDTIGLLNSCLSHKDPEFWNTKDGLHPVNSFWAERFLIDPSDPRSGPINPALGQVPRASEKVNGDKPYYSVEGLESSWFPYGGGYSICPGRHLAKLAIIYTCAVFVSEFEIEVLTDTIEFDSWRFGLGMQVPKNPLPFRIRRRAVDA